MYVDVDNQWDNHLSNEENYKSVNIIHYFYYELVRQISKIIYLLILQ